MSDIEKAARDAVEAADNTELVRAIAAVIAAQQMNQPQQQRQEPAPRQEFNATRWLVIGGVLVSGGLVASLFAVAVAICGVSVGLLALVLRSMWRDFQKGN
ncbi:hypothetical protein [Streptomyces europaeiscabiei]|uniref:hypothetical protein n=1 Tax=Streptomyces europaeiscabiei TaxID=146819 RepID=UPI0029A52947|nr:hypothetical protein [Streptomyces europaeiscabiei]MDX2770649.1 hypothetical protein [Streptomyces europaeiscabiei]